MVNNLNFVLYFLLNIIYIIMPNKKYSLSLFAIVIFIILYFKYRRSNNDTNPPKKVDIMLQKAKNEINQSKDKWLVFNTSKKYILTGDSSTYTANVKEDVISINKDGKFTGTRGIQKTKFDPSSAGRFDNTVANINFSRGEKRFTINIGNNTIIITGYGTFSDSSYPHPWYQVIPLVFKEGGSVVATIDYVEKPVVTSDTKYLPIEITVRKTYEKYIPLFFQIHVLSQEFVNSVQ